MKKYLTHNELNSLHVDVTDNGFALWVKEKNESTKTIQQHWLLDASCLKDDLCIRLGAKDCENWKIKAVYNEEENCIYITKSKK